MVRQRQQARQEIRVKPTTVRTIQTPGSEVDIYWLGKNYVFEGYDLQVVRTACKYVQLQALRQRTWPSAGVLADCLARGIAVLLEAVFRALESPRGGLFEGNINYTKVCNTLPPHL
jgi:hypothetical protein